MITNIIFGVVLVLIAIQLVRLCGGLVHYIKDLWKEEHEK
jgi:Flp pilus assembly pilin Flp